MYENDGFHPYEDNNDAQNRYEAQSSETSGNQWQQPLYQMPQQPEHTQPKKKHTAGRVVALALCCSLLGGAVGAGAMAIGTSMTGTSGGSRSSSTSTILQGDRPTSAINVSKIDTSKEMTAAEVYAANVNSTVGITTSITTNYWGYQTTAAASGSGFILTADGYILTNYHVIENSNSVKVTMYDGASYDATIVGYDESNDIVVLKIDATGLTPVVLGDSDELNVGDPVVAIGNPLGELTFSPDVRRRERAEPRGHALEQRHDGPHPDGLRHQLRQLRRCAVQPLWRGHRHHECEVFQQRLLR